MEATNGVLLPTIWLPITTLPHPMSLQIRTEALRAIVDDTVAGLYAAGARTVCVVTGHYAQGHLIELYEGAMRAMDDHEDLRVLVSTPLQPLGEDALLDHAGRYEASQLMAIRPDLVHADRVVDPISPKASGVLGADPRVATAQEGEALLTRGVQAWIKWIAESTPENLNDDYGKRFDALQAYVDAYYEGSWDEAILKWWAAK